MAPKPLGLQKVWEQGLKSYKNPCELGSIARMARMSLHVVACDHVNGPITMGQLCPARHCSPIMVQNGF